MKNQKGISTIEVVLLIVIIGLVGGIGWYVWNSKSDSDTSKAVNKSSDNQSSQVQKDKDVIKTGYKLYDGKYYSIQHPEGWLAENQAQYEKHVGDSKISTVDENTLPFWMHFTSPDFKAPSDGLGPSVESGYWLEVKVSKKASDISSHEAALKSAEEGKKIFGGSYEEITIDGKKSVISNITSHGTFWETTTYTDDKEYYFRFNSVDEEKPEVKELFKDILSTVRLK